MEMVTVGELEPLQFIMQDQILTSVLVLVLTLGIKHTL